MFSSGASEVSFRFSLIVLSISSVFDSLVPKIIHVENQSLVNLYDEKSFSSWINEDSMF